MAVYLSPIGNGFQFMGSSLVLLNGGLLNTYAAGTTTPQATFTTSTGNIQNANPIVMNSDGRPPSEIWLTGGVSYKFVLTDSLANTLGTYDNIYGIGDPQAPNSGAGPQLLINAAGGNAITVTANPPPSAYAAGQSWWLTPPTTNTAAVTVNISGLGNRATAKGKAGGLVALTQSDFISGNPYLLEDNGTLMVAVNNPTYEFGGTVTAASTINLDTNTGDYSVITGGGTTVTSVQLAPGRLHQLQVTNVSVTSTIVFQNSSSLIMAGASSVTATAGDIVTFRGDLSGVVRNVSYFRGATGGTAGKSPTLTTITSGVAQTYTVPTGVTWFRIRLIGGGAGGGGATANNGGTGNNTTFSTLTGGGGQPGQGNSGVGGTGGTAVGPAGSITIPGGSGGGGSGSAAGNQAGGDGGNGVFGGGGGGGNSAANGLDGAANSGGGGGGGAGNGGNSGGGGGSGGYVEAIFTAPLSATYTYTVGASVSGGAAGTTAGGNGAAGRINIEEHYD